MDISVLQMSYGKYVSHGVGDQKTDTKLYKVPIQKLILAVHSREKKKQQQRKQLKKQANCFNMTTSFKIILYHFHKKWVF